MKLLTFYVFLLACHFVFLKVSPLATYKPRPPQIFLT
jgi:hypothetical protein